jgi:hypothetical protein
MVALGGMGMVSLVSLGSGAHHINNTNSLRKLTRIRIYKMVRSISKS